MKPTHQQKIADVLRIVLYVYDDTEVLWDIYPDAETLVEIKNRIKEIQTDLKYGKLRYRKEEAA